MHPRKININMAAAIVTSVPSGFLMMGPFLLSMGDQWHMVMTEKPHFLADNGRSAEMCTPQSPRYRSTVYL